MNKPKILVGCPTYWGKGYCLKKYAERVKALSYENYDVMLVDNTEGDSYIEQITKEGLRVIKGPWSEDARERIINSRNLLRDKLLEGGYDYFLSLEQDIIPPKDVIERLLARNKEIITGAYYKEGSLPDGRKTSYALLYVEQQGKLVLVHPERLKNKELITINACGLGCILIHRKVLEKIRFRKPEKGPAQDDMMFCYDAQKAGFELYVDTDVVCEHLHKDWKEAEKELSRTTLHRRI